MLIRAVTKQDIPAWLALAHERDLIVYHLTTENDKFWAGFKSWAERKVQKNEAFMAIDRITDKCLGAISFSKKNNRISFISVTKSADFNTVAEKLLAVVLNHMDNTKAITANVLKSESSIVKKELALYEKLGFRVHLTSKTEFGLPTRQLAKTPSGAKTGYSFHYDYPGYAEWTDEKKCPVCNWKMEMENRDLIAELKHSRLYASPNAQGGLWGKCEIYSKKHFVELHDMPAEELAEFMKDVQKTARALKQVSGAVKINLEQHGNTVPHLHLHLYPRYLDDLHAGKPIDYNITEPSAYESKEEYDFFIRRMREKLQKQVIEIIFDTPVEEKPKSAGV